MIKAATPRVIPPIERNEIIEIKLMFRLLRRYRKAKKSDNDPVFN